MTIEEFIQELQKLNISLTNEQIDQFEKYYLFLIQYNQKVNLTRITEKEEVYLKHFYDSILIYKLWPYFGKDKVNLCDVGSGAGFPSIPLKIIFPNLKVTIVDSLNKRIMFLNELCKQLNLKYVSLVHGRAEEVGHNTIYRNSFDVVTGRALAKLSVMNELCLPLVKVGGFLIAMKGQKAEEEIKGATNSLNVLGGQLEKVDKFYLFNTDNQRNNILIKKVKETPKKYPRKAGTPNRHPL
ncbi:MAG: 16S rRNA (guanine(527)-N(7))-methyltransferase RsmG [Firmicutes bacterium]|uniref:Ribosomal RNA small subunit methyltransferase G n=1 Tax=Candidatus Gallilactobacillus intestinavium TaxID=2840838 RepID=A0A9D9E762_9LACO|nr:16S rRNA (guanine(527)-N(7))-methyltransferase RsmG [Candidatus Gallilactobacillus intestinavium]